MSNKLVYLIYGTALVFFVSLFACINSHAATQSLNEGFSSATANSNAVSPSNFSTVPNGSGGFLTNAFTTTSASTELSAALSGNKVDLSQKMTAGGLAFGMNTTPDVVTASLDLAVNGVKPDKFTFSANGVADAGFTGTQGFSQSFVTGSITAVGANDLSGALSSGAFASGGGLNAATATAGSSLNFTLP